jgi:lysophospholipase L1-like esterase
MNSHWIVTTVAGLGCLAIGLTAGVGLAIAKPGKIRQWARQLGRPDYNQQWSYEQTIKFHKRVDACVPDGSVLFVGDSFIEGMCVTAVEPGGVNYGIGGDTTEGVLGRLPIYSSMTRARAVVFAMGDNDLRQGRSEAEVAANYQKIVAQVPKTVPIFFCSLTPCLPGPQFVEINRGIASLNRSLKELCGSQPRCHLVDLGPTFNDEHGCLRREFAEDDGMHLNGQGYRLCIEKVREALLPVLATNANSGV